MLESVLRRADAVFRRIRRIERREIREFRRWIEHTGNLLHLSILIFVPLLIGLVTIVSNAVAQLSFLLFPPLASGTYTLFADPEGRYASPGRFVAGLTVGALCGWIALEVTARHLYQVPPGQFEVHAGAAALSVFLTGLVTWGLDLEEPAAVSTALLVLVTGTSRLSYVVSVAAASALVAGVFVLWRREFYEHRAEYLYQSIQGDDHVLVPMRGETATQTALFAARLAAAHEAGKVVLVAIVEDGGTTPASASVTGRPGHIVDDDGGRPTSDVAKEAADRLENEAQRIRTRVGVPVQIVVASTGGTEAATVKRVAREANCDLIVTPYEERTGALAPFVRGLFAGETDAIVFRSRGDRETWRRILVPVRRTGDVAHAMVDFARRLAGRSGTVAACHCIGAERERRRAETMLANLVETFPGSFETRVAKADIATFLAANSGNYDLAIIGASTDRTATSRFISPPTFERLRDLQCDVAVVHRGR